MNESNVCYAVLGTTGTVAQAVAERLLRLGKEVRLIGENLEKMQPLIDLGAEAHVIGFQDPIFVAQALQGVTAVFTGIPRHPSAANHNAYQSRVGESIALALKHSDVQHVVNLSSVGAHLDDKTGPVRELHYQELRLNQLEAISVIHLRAGYLMENLLSQVETVKRFGVVGSAIKPYTVIPMVAARDVAGAACRLLVELGFSGKSSREVLGERSVTMAEVTEVLGRAIGKYYLKYAIFPFATSESLLCEGGASESYAKSVSEWCRALNEGWLQPSQARQPSNTTLTSIEDFSWVFANRFYDDWKQQWQSAMGIRSESR